jgi:hypothetical protein
MRRALLILLAVASPALAKQDKPVPACPVPYKQPLFISPMGEPFRPKGDAKDFGDDPIKRWFDQADRNHDGKLTLGEMTLDADRFFATLDKDGNGELLPDEVNAYEQDVAPEVRLFQGQPNPYGADKAGQDDDDRARRRQAKRPAGGMAEGVIGAGRYSFLNIPDPVASADDDVNRAVDKHEFEQAAAERFNELDPQQTKALTLASLPKTPAQVAANAACLAKVAREAKEKRR